MTLDVLNATSPSIPLPFLLQFHRILLELYLLLEYFKQIQATLTNQCRSLLRNASVTLLFAESVNK